jgi:hypothetical protein
VSFATIILCVASQRMFIVVVYFVINSVRKLLDTPSYVMQTDGYSSSSSSFLCSTAQFRPWPPPQNPAEFFGGFSIIFFFTG